MTPFFWYHDERIVTRNGNQRNTYSGLYYDVRELFDLYGLPWGESGKIILTAISAGKKGLRLRDTLIPSEKHRAWFRAAKVGIGAPTPDEIRKAGKMTNSMRRRDLSKGLTIAEIANQNGVSERTVRNALSKVRRWYKSLGWMG